MRVVGPPAPKSSIWPPQRCSYSSMADIGARMMQVVGPPVPKSSLRPLKGCSRSRSRRVMRYVIRPVPKSSILPLLVRPPPSPFRMISTRSESSTSFAPASTDKNVEEVEKLCSGALQAEPPVRAERKSSFLEARPKVRPARLLEARLNVGVTTPAGIGRDGAEEGEHTAEQGDALESRARACRRAAQGDET